MASEGVEGIEGIEGALLGGKDVYFPPKTDLAYIFTISIS